MRWQTLDAVIPKLISFEPKQSGCFPVHILTHCPLPDPLSRCPFLNPPRGRQEGEGRPRMAITVRGDVPGAQDCNPPAHTGV